MMMMIWIKYNDGNVDCTFPRETSDPIARFLSWALHIFAFDLAYEPEGWPWKPVSKKLPWNKNAITRNLIHLYGCIHSAQIKSVVVGFHELLVTVPASPGDLMAQVSDDVNRIQTFFKTISSHTDNTLFCFPQACVYFSLPACLAWLLKPPHGPSSSPSASLSRSQSTLARG